MWYLMDVLSLTRTAVPLMVGLQTHTASKHHIDQGRTIHAAVFYKQFDVAMYEGRPVLMMPESMCHLVEEHIRTALVAR